RRDAARRPAGHTGARGARGLRVYASEPRSRARARPGEPLVSRRQHLPIRISYKARFALARAAAMRVQNRLDHELELVEERFLVRLWERVQVFHELDGGDLLLVKLPRRDLLFDHAAEELRLADA